MSDTELLVCWIDPDYDRAQASDSQSRYGAYVRDHARLFDPWQDAPDRVTRDPVEFAIASFRVATGPIMWPGFVRWHPRICGYGTERSDDGEGRLVVSVTLATPAPLRLLSWVWRSWDRDFGDRYLEPEDRGPVALARLELRWPLNADQLHRPARPRMAGRPNLVDATAAVAAVVGSVNDTAGPGPGRPGGRPVTTAAPGPHPEVAGCRGSGDQAGRLDSPARLDPGMLLAALGELNCARAAPVYAALGFPVIPMHTARPGGACTCADRACSDPGKHPRLAGWQRLATVDPAVVGEWWRRWPQANLGLATGRRFDVLDLDGDLGVEALRATLSIAPTEHPGPVARTGGGGWHLLYAPTGHGNRVGLLAGVDWRGRDGLIVAPPSQHLSGIRYTWARPLTATLPEVPAGLRRLLAPPSTARTTLPPATPTSGRSGGYGPAALAGERTAVATASPGRRNATLNRAAFNLGQLVAAGLLDAEEVRSMLLAAALEAGNPKVKAIATIASGLRGGAAKPRRRRDRAT